MGIKKLSFMLLSALSLAALLNGCGSSSKDGSPGGVTRVADEGVCIHCHSITGDHTSGTGIVEDYATASHNPNNSAHATGCEGCHGGGSQHNGVGPFPYPNPFDAYTENGTTFENRCVSCHLPAYSGGRDMAPLFALAKVAGFTNKCAHCHTASGKGSVHGAGQQSNKGCIDCHDVAAPNHGAGLVDDNNGVRAITSEFAKWSHHVTGVKLNDAHCAACHLEGKVEDGAIVVDTTKHMTDNKTHLRDTSADTDADFAWNPAAPNFTGMDNYCMSCHDTNGAVSPMSNKIQNFINDNGLAAEGKAASPLNPFGDTISNQYDKLERPAVVDAKAQFATGNNSHHAVSGKKYTGRTRTGATRAIATPSTFAVNSTAALPGVRTTIYDAGKFQADYTTLADAAGETGARNGGTTLGDDSTLHCADCHTVGQYSALAPGFGGRYNKAVIGAHGSNNEYLLRNNIGTDQRHQGAETTGAASGVATVGYGTKPYLVCFNCHAFSTYGSIGGATSIAGLNHAGEYANSTRCNGPNNTVFGAVQGEARLESVNTQTDSTSYSREAGSTFGNVFGIQCNNCHNSGTTAGNIFGGIHGSKDQTYKDGMGNTTKHFRFMPGLGNAMYVPGTKGGFSGGSLKTYYSYSSNRLTGAALIYTPLPVRTIVPGVGPAASTLINGNTVPSQVMPYLNVLPAKGVVTGSYQYTTGGTSSDLNWEQKSAQPVAGQYDFQAKAMGCYTVAPNSTEVGYVPKVAAVVNGDGTVVEAAKFAATDLLEAGAKGPNGETVMFDNWGGCDDHNGAQGAGTAPYRKVLRKTSY